MTKPNRRIIYTTVLMVLLLSLAGLAYGEDAKLFSHKKHADEGAECGDCHDSSSEGVLLPTKETCGQCHDEDPVFGAKPAVSARKLIVKFPHVKHAESLECKSCHKAVSEESQKAGEAILTFDKCKECHGENGVEISEKTCIKCHGVKMRHNSPTDHKKAWITRHGKESSWREFDDHGKECSLCHREQTCKNCHRLNKPTDHSGLWRIRLHGKDAEWDRGRCKTCHETGTCVNCHRTTRPNNHKGNWRFLHSKAAGGSSDTCKVCHRIYEPQCAECHTKGK